MKKKLLLEDFSFCVVLILSSWFNMCPAEFHQIRFCGRELLGCTVSFGTPYNNSVKSYIEKRVRVLKQARICCSFVCVSSSGFSETLSKGTSKNGPWPLLTFSEALKKRGFIPICDYIDHQNLSV